jgi:hypothetical protein
MKTFDWSMILLSALTVLTLCVGFFTQDSDFLLTLGDTLTLLSHLFILPSILLTVKSPWLWVLISLTAVASVVYHLCETDVIDRREIVFFEEMDMTAQSVLIWLTAFLFLFDDFPPLGFLALMVVLFVMSTSSERKVLGVPVYYIVDFLPVFAVFVFNLYKLMDYDEAFFRSKRPYRFTLLFFGYFTLALIFFVVGDLNHDTTRRFYLFSHTSWHVLAYTALYFSLRARSTAFIPRAVKIKRTDFAYKRLPMPS